jgi:hypothetical protein
MPLRLMFSADRVLALGLAWLPLDQPNSPLSAARLQAAILERWM